MKGGAGFTLIELLVTVSIIFLLSAIIFANYRQTESQFNLLRSVNKLAQDTRMTQAMAMSMKEYEGTLPKGYGVYLNEDTKDRYIMYKDISEPANDRYDANEDEDIDTIYFERGVRIKSVSSAQININFKPPDPTTTLKNDSGIAFDSVDIILELETDPTKTKTIKVNKAGLIDVD